jgi:hypothetical protein
VQRETGLEPATFCLGRDEASTCERLAELGLPLARLSSAEIARVAVARDIVEAINTTMAWRWLIDRDPAAEVSRTHASVAMGARRRPGRRRSHLCQDSGGRRFRPHAHTAANDVVWPETTASTLATERHRATSTSAWATYWISSSDSRLENGRASVEAAIRSVTGKSPGRNPNVAR